MKKELKALIKDLKRFERTNTIEQSFEEDRLYNIS